MTGVVLGFLAAVFAAVFFVRHPRFALALEALTLPFQAVFIIQFGANIKISELLGVAVVLSWLWRVVSVYGLRVRVNAFVAAPAAVFVMLSCVSLIGTITHYSILSQVSLASVTGVTTGRQAPLSRGLVTAAWAAFSVLNMLATANLVRTQRQLARLVDLVLVASALAAAYAFYKLLFLNFPLPQLWFPGDITTGWARAWLITRSDGTFLEPSTMANYFIVLIPLTLAARLVQPRPRWSVIVAAQLIGLISSFSPGGWLTFVPAIGLWGVLAIRAARRPIPGAVKSLAKVVASVAFTGALVFLTTGFKARQIAYAVADKVFGESGLVSSELSRANASSREARLGLSRIAVEMWRENPVLGVGIGNYPFLHQHYADLAHLEYREEVTNTPSVLYLLLAAETGTLGLALFLVFGWRLSALVWRSARRIDDPELKRILLGMGGSFIGIAVNGVVLDNPFVNYYWYLAGLALAAVRLASRSVRSQARVAPETR